jgi:hypothetical protein
MAVETPQKQQDLGKYGGRIRAATALPVPTQSQNGHQNRNQNQNQNPNPNLNPNQKGRTAPTSPVTPSNALDTKATQNQNQNRIQNQRERAVTTLSSSGPAQETKAQARDVVKQILDLANCIKRKDTFAYVSTAKLATNKMNVLLNPAKAYGLINEEQELRQAVFDLILCGKSFFDNESTENDFDAAAAGVATAIRNLVAAIALATPTQAPTESAEKKEEVMDEAKRKRIRAKVLKEMLDTETTYFTQLKTLDFNFIAPLKEQDSILFRDAQVNSMFSALPSILSLSKDLVGTMRNRITAGADADTITIGDVFVRFGPAFKMYQVYINNYDTAMPQLRAIIDASSELTQFTKQFCQSAGQQDISFFLILPIQRLPRYELLLREILKLTPPTAAEYSQLEQAIATMKVTNNSINQKKKEDQNWRKILAIQSAIITPKPLHLVEPGRMYIREGVMDELVGKKKRKGFYYFLFSDILIKTKVDKKHKKEEQYQYKYIATIPLNRVTLQDIVLSDSELLNMFKLVANEEETYIFNCMSEDEKHSWMKDIEDAIQKSRNT